MLWQLTDERYRELLGYECIVKGGPLPVDEDRAPLPMSEDDEDERTHTGLLEEDA